MCNIMETTIRCSLNAMEAMMLHEWDNYTLHQFDGVVDAKKRVSMSETIYRDLKIEHKIRERYEVANRYYQDYLKELKS